MFNASGVLLDRETIPVVKDGENGSNTVRLDINNEMDMIPTTAALRIDVARTVETTVRLFDGATEVDISTATISVSGGPASTIATASQAADGKGKKLSWAFKAGQTMAEAYDITISYTYKNVAYTAVFTVSASKGEAVWQLKPSMSAIPFQRNADNTLTPASRAVGLSLVKIDGGSTATYTSVQTGLTVRYSTSSMPSSASAGTGWESGNITVANTADNLYIAMFNASGVLLDRETIPVIKDGEKGDKGDSVFYDEEHSSIGYAYSSMGTPEAGRDYPSDITSWSPTPPAVQKGKYLWTKDVTAYNNAGTIVYTTTYGVQYQPNDGESVEIDSSRTFIKYCRQTKSQYTGQHPADRDFSTTYPTNLGQGDYLWILNQVAYVGVANPLKSYSVSMLGTDGSKGDPGADGYTTHFAYATSADGSQNFSTTNFNGATYIGTYRDRLPNDSTNYRDYVWTPWKGDKGDKGDSVFYDEEHSSIGYAYSSKGTPEAGRDYPSDITSWSPTPPAVQKGKYLWTKDVTAYNNAGTIVYTTTYGVQYQPNDGESVEIDSSRTFIKYCRQTKSQYTGQHPADRDFSTTYPTNLGQGDYLWILNQVAYVGVANPLKSYSVSMLGTDGSKGDPGADGYTTHFAYATSADGSQNFSTTNFNGATYIGTYRDRNAADSTNYRDYVWTPWKGDKGEQGEQGEQGEGGYGLSLTPTSLILESMISNNQEVVNYVNNVVTVRVMKGSTPVQLTCSVLTGTSSHSSNISISSSNIPVNNAGTYSTVTLAGGINLNNGESGFFTVHVSTSDGKFSQDVRINFYVNRAATFARQIKNGIETAMGAQTEYSYDQLGGVIKTAYQADIQTSAKGLTQQFTEQISKAGDYNRNLFGFHKYLRSRGESKALPFIQGYGIVANNYYNNRLWGRLSNLGFNGVGGYFVVSFQAKISQSVTGYINVNICDVNGIQGKGSLSSGTTIQVNGQWNEYEIYYFIPEDNPYMIPSSYNGFIDFEETNGAIYSNSAYLYVRHLKIERGQTKTDFCEADEDVAYLGHGNVAKNLNFLPYRTEDAKNQTVDGRGGVYRIRVPYLTNTYPWGDTTNTFRDYLVKNNFFNLEAGKCYTLSFWAKASVNGFVITQHLYQAGYTIINSIGNDIYVDPSNGTIQESIMSDGQTQVKLSTTWTQYFVHFYVANNVPLASVIPLRVHKNYNNSSARNLAYIYMSDIELQEGYVTSADYFASFISQNARRISLVQQSGTKLSGIDIQNGTVNLFGDRVTFSNSTGTVSGKVWIDPDDGTIHATDGEFTGKVTSGEGEIGGFTIGSNEIKSEVSANESLTLNKDGSFTIINGSNSVKMNTNGFEVMFGGEGFRVGNFGTGHQGMERWDSIRNVWAPMYERKIAKVFKATSINLGSAENKSVNYVLNARVDWDNHTTIYLPSSSDVPNGASIIVRGLARDCDSFVYPKQGSNDTILAGDYKREAIEVLAADCAEFIWCKGINTYIRAYASQENPSVYVADAWLCNMYDRDV